MMNKLCKKFCKDKKCKKGCKPFECKKCLLVLAAAALAVTGGSAYLFLL